MQPASRWPDHKLCRGHTHSSEARAGAGMPTLRLASESMRCRPREVHTKSAVASGGMHADLSIRRSFHDRLQYTLYQSLLVQKMLQYPSLQWTAFKREVDRLRDRGRRTVNMSAVAAVVPGRPVALAPRSQCHRSATLCCAPEKHSHGFRRGRHVAARASEQDAPAVDTSNLEGQFQLAESTISKH